MEPNSKKLSGGPKRMLLRQLVPEIYAFYQMYGREETMKHYGMKNKLTLDNLLSSNYGKYGHVSGQNACNYDVGEWLQENDPNTTEYFKSNFERLKQIEREVDYYRDRVQIELDKNKLLNELVREDRAVEIRAVKELINRVNGMIDYIADKVAVILLDQAIKPFLRQLISDQHKDDITTIGGKITGNIDSGLNNLFENQLDDITYKLRLLHELDTLFDDPKNEYPAGNLGGEQPGTFVSGDHGGEGPR